MNAFLRRVPLRVKLVAAVLALVAMALVAISVASAVLLRDYLIDRVDRQLDAATRQIVSLEEPPTAGELPSDFMFAFQGPRGTQTYRYHTYSIGDLPKLPGNLAESAEVAGTPYTVRATDGDPRWRVLVTRTSPERAVIVGSSLSNVDSAVERLIWIDILVGCAGLVVLAAVGVTIVRRSLRPLAEIERTAVAIGQGDLTRRVPDFEDGADVPRTEVGGLAKALNAMLAQIEAAFTARAASETRARRSEERMRQFVADASHELRTPLTTIRGFAELYRQGAARTEEETARLLRRIEAEAFRMGLLVEDLLLLARLDRERPLQLVPVELPVVAADAVHAARAVAPDRRVTLEIEDEAGPLVVLGDDARLRQVVGNLMANALAHTRAGTPVTVRLCRAGDSEAVLEVSDAGPGLTPEQADRVFERFYRIDAARTRPADGPTGTGLGLAIVAALVAAHSGTVEVDSRPGEGATFRVRLPLAPQGGAPAIHGRGSQPIHRGVPGGRQQGGAVSKA